MPASAYLNDNSLCHLGTFFTTVSQTITRWSQEIHKSAMMFTVYLFYMIN